METDLHHVVAALSKLDAAPLDDDQEQPLFLLSASWRSGSTLLQRVLMTDPSVMLWGEPLGPMSFITRCKEGLCMSAKDWPPSRYWITDPSNQGDLATSWIANLYPPAADLRLGMRQWLLHWLAAPARARGYSRWGMKEVRLDAGDAYFLKWLFPRASFVVIVRNPLDSYASFRKWQGFWDRWPDRFVGDAAAFGRHWNRLALSWKDVRGELDPVLIQYEDLAAVDYRALEQRLGLKLDEARALAAHIGARTSEPAPPPAVVSDEERQQLAAEAAAGMAAFGYAR